MSATKIIRRPDRAEGGITDAERRLMAEHVKLWTARAFRTDPIEPEAITAAIYGLYEAAGLKRPRVVIVPSPLVMAVASGFASEIWRIRHRDATRDATFAATDIATHAATFDATFDATFAATFAATDAATRAATDAATYEAWAVPLSKALGGEHWRLLLDNVLSWSHMIQGGNMWAAAECYLTAARDILGLRLPAHAKYAHWEQAAIHGGFRAMHPEFCMVSDFPDRLLVDDRNRPHCADGPSHRWRDGWSLYFWHGVRVTQQVIERPSTLTVAQIQGEQNAEVRRVMMERYGWERYAQDAGAKVRHRDDWGTLWELPRPKPERPLLCVEVVNSTMEPDGTFKRYWLSVGGDPATALDAVASTWRSETGERMTGTQYAKRLVAQS